MHSLTGLAENTIIRGIREVKQGKPEKMGQRVREKGAGRQPIDRMEPDVLDAIQKIVDESTAGNPMSPIKMDPKILSDY